jgi:WD40 repeat protein
MKMILLALLISTLLIGKGASADTEHQANELIVRAFPDDETPTSIAMNPDASRVAVAGRPLGWILVFDARTGVKVGESKAIKGKSYSSIVETLEFAPDGKSLAASREQKILIFNGDGGNPRYSKEFQYSPKKIAFSPDGKRLVFISPQSSNFLCVLNVATLAVEWCKTYTGREKELSSSHNHAEAVRWTPDGRSVVTVTGGGDGIFAIYSAVNGELKKTIKDIRDGSTTTIGSKFIISPDSREVYSLGSSALRYLSVWSLETGELVRRIAKAPDMRKPNEHYPTDTTCQAVQWLPESKAIACGTEGHSGGLGGLGVSIIKPESLSVSNPYELNPQNQNEKHEYGKFAISQNFQKYATLFRAKSSSGNFFKHTMIRIGGLPSSLLTSSPP